MEDTASFYCCSEGSMAMTNDKNLFKVLMNLLQNFYQDYIFLVVTP